MCCPDLSCAPAAPQLLGFSDVVTGALAVCASVGAAVGFLLGGGVGDFLAMKYPDHARAAVNQASILLTGPLYVIFLKALPGGRCSPCLLLTSSLSCIPCPALSERAPPSTLQEVLLCLYPPAEPATLPRQRAACAHRAQHTRMLQTRTFVGR